MITYNNDNILIFGDINYGDDTDLLAAIAEGGLKPILLSSCGGCVYTAQRMLAILDAQNGVQIRCIGEVMSAATMLLCTKGARITADSGCVFLVHGASVYDFYGNKADLDYASAEIALINDAMLQIMTRRMQPDAVLPMLSVDAIFGAARAKDLGLVDEIDTPLSASANGKTYRMVASTRYIRLQAAAAVQKSEGDMEDEEKKVEEVLEEIDLEDDAVEEEEEEKKPAVIEEDAEEALDKLRKKLASLSDLPLSRVSKTVLSIYEEGHLSASDTILRLFDLMQEDQGDATDAKAAATVHVAAKRVKVQASSAPMPVLKWEGWR